MRADPEASDLLAAVGRECGATSRWGCIKTSGPLSQLIALLTARTTFNMSEFRLSSTHETCLGEREEHSASSSSFSVEDEKPVDIDSGKERRDDWNDQGAGGDLEKGWEGKMSREEISSPIYEVWKEFGGLRMGLTVLREIWKGRWQT